MAKTYPKYDYDLPEGLFQELSELAVTELEKELTGRKPGEDPASTSPGQATKEFFRASGQRAARAVLAAGEKYPDRTAEVMAEAAKKTGRVFPGLPQRYLEIWLLATRPRDKWRILENSPRRLTFAVSECAFHELVKKNTAGESALPCREYCLAFLEELYQRLGLAVQVTQPATMMKSQNNGCCFESELIANNE